VQEHCSRPLSYGLDSAFRDTVLVLSPDSRESHFLIGIQGILKVLCIKGLVIGMIMFNNDSVFRCETFKGILRHMAGCMRKIREVELYVGIPLFF
jgi:hypothetical protein